MTIQLLNKNISNSGKSVSFNNFLKTLPVVILLLLTSLSYAQTGTWTKVATNCPNENNGVALLLTDGTVIAKNNVGTGNGTGWDRLTPDIHGSYANGTWTTIASMINDRLFFSTQVLPSGKVYAAGGEYGAGTNQGEVYDPVTNIWTACGAIPGGWKIYDGNSQLLYTGNVLEGPQIGSATSYNILQWSPTTLNYTTEANAPLNHDEAEWVKLPDSSVLYVGIASTSSCRFLPKYNKWHNDATVPVSLFDPFGEEQGCGFMLPNGKVIMFGATQHNAIYTPSGDTNSGTWTAAADFPIINGAQVGQPDASGAMLVNGHILLAVSPIGTSKGDEFRAPTYFVEYNYLTNMFTQVTSIIPGQGADSLAGIPSYQTQMLNLPDGTILVTISQAGGLSNQYFIYTPGSAAIAQGKPTINKILPDGCPNYKITGKLFNGISEGAAYGDDWQCSTNYPIIRLTNGTNVYYAKTTLWNRIGAVQTDSLEDTAVFTPPASLPAGTYSLVVVVNGFPSNPVLFQTLGITIASHTNVLCNGGNTGSATATAAGGLTPYTYLWSPSGGTNIAATNLSVGTYTVKVTDNNGCTATASVAITQPATLTVSDSVTANVSCNGGSNGSVSSTPAGGTSPYTYLWTGGSTISTETGLSIGTYIITLTDKNGCSATASATITQPPALNVTDTVTANVTCNGGNTGSVSSTPSGGVSPYTYSWTGGGTNSTETGLSAGTYTITVTDKNGCSATASAAITQPNLLSVSANITATINCNGGNNGSVSSTPSGGVSPYTYSWTGGSTVATETGLSAGIYTITVTDSNGCTATATAALSQPNVLTTAAIASSNVSCNGESNGIVSATPSGGTSPYTYAWSGGGTNSTKTGLPTGTYTVTVTDKNGCTGTATAAITQPVALSIAQGSLPAAIGNCNGSAWVTASGGTPAYTYKWNPGGATTDTINGQCAGSYCCKVTDKNGCMDSICITILTGIQELSNASSIKVYPDPNTGNFAVSGLLRGQIIELYNYVGQKLSSTVVDNATMHFNIEGNANGVYLVRIVNKDGSIVTQKKMVKTQ